MQKDVFIKRKYSIQIYFAPQNRTQHGIHTTGGEVSRASALVYAQTRHCNFLLRVTKSPRLRGLELVGRHTKLEHFGERSGKARAGA